MAETFNIFLIVMAVLAAGVRWPRVRVRHRVVVRVVGRLYW